MAGIIKLGAVILIPNSAAVCVYARKRISLAVCRNFNSAAVYIAAVFNVQIFIFKNRAFFKQNPVSRHKLNFVYCIKCFECFCLCRAAV